MPNHKAMANHKVAMATTNNKVITNHKLATTNQLVTVITNQRKAMAIALPHKLATKPQLVMTTKRPKPHKVALGMSPMTMYHSKH